MAVWSHSIALLPAYLAHLIELTPCGYVPICLARGVDAEYLRSMLCIPTWEKQVGVWVHCSIRGHIVKSVIFLPSSLKSASWPVIVSCSPHKMKWTKTCIRPSDISPCTGEGEAFLSNVAYLFIYLRWILAASRVSPSGIIAVALDASICCRGDVPTPFVGASLLQ